MLQGSNLEQYQHMWDGSENWGLIQHDASFTKLAIHFAGRVPTVAEIISLRKLFPEYRNMPPKELKLKLGSSGHLVLGPMPRMMANPIWWKAIDLKLNIERDDFGAVYYQMIERTKNFSLLIEDADLGNRIVQAMLEHGVPIIGYAHMD